MDREKIIKAIDICLGHGKRNDCSYHSGANYSDQNCRGRMLRDVLTLLKEQKQKTGHWTTKITLQHDGEWYCDQCEYEPTVFENTLFCPNCGAKMEGGEAE